MNKASLVQRLLWKFRVIDLISALVGLFFIVIYWIFDGQWVINDIMSICTIVALMKLVKLRSLVVGVLLVGGLILL